MKKTVLILDMYGVILKESKGNFIPYTYNYFDENEHERLTKMFREERIFTKAAMGEITSDEFLTILGYDNPQFHMKNYIENHLTLDDGFIPFAEKYAKYYDFVLLSNDVSEWSSYITEYYQINKYFKHKIVSGEVNCRKPGKQIYELTIEKIQKEASECYFVDNSVGNLCVARELGIAPILFNRDGESYEDVTVNSFEELADLIAR
ncbi:MAG: HAD family hydrolase [Clostridia bacterium]|nr:HAD family hydrolase [Clostridia bacterium]